MLSELSPSFPGILQERISQTRRGLLGLRDEIKKWIELREKRDLQRQYVTQLKTLRIQIEYLLAQVERELESISAGDGPLSVYARCRVVDKRILWIRRLWTYFQSKFDQRDDEKLKRVLRAADDIVWSCYAQPYRVLKIQNQPSQPLPFITPVYSPYAIPRDEPPQDLRSDVDAEFLGAMLQQMPIPVVGIPAQSIEEPWMLAFLAHEVGHHVQFDLRNGAMIDSFSDMLLAKGGQRWRPWGKELFADLYSLLMIGHWALWALADLVWSDPASMLDDTNSRYPCALVRLVFMSSVADKLGLNGSKGLRGLIPAELLDHGPVLIKSRDIRETARVPDGELSKLCEFHPEDFKEYQGVAYLWGEALAGRGSVAAKKSLRSARLVLSGGVRAWAEICELTDEKERENRRGPLKGGLLSSIVANGEDTVRAASAETDLDSRNRRLASLVMSSEIPGIGS